MSPTDADTHGHDDHADGRPVVLFDLDGVFTKRDTFSTLVVRRLRTSPWRLAVAVPALPVLAATRRYPAVHGRASRYLVRVALAGLTMGTARRMAGDLGREFARTTEWLRPNVIRAAQAHLSAGDRVVVVTATEHTLARTLLDSIGLQGVDLHASTLGRTRTGPGLTTHNYGAAKRRTLASAGVPEPWTRMYSDSWADHDLLDHVDHVTLVHPSPALRRRSAQRWPACSVILDEDVDLPFADPCERTPRRAARKQ